MPLRAQLDEQQDVFSFSADDDLWLALADAYKAERLQLPCCGTAAIPKEHPRTGTRFFAHKPYAAQSCDWKATGEGHEELVLAAVHIAINAGWQVVTDVWAGKVCVDLVCSHPDMKKSIAIMVETAPADVRPAEQIERENSELVEAGATGTLWLLPADKNRPRPHGVKSEFFHRGEKRNPIAEVAAHIKRHLHEVYNCVTSTEKLLSALIEDGWTGQVTFRDNLPDQIIASPEGSDIKYPIGLRGTIDLSLPREAEDEAKSAYLDVFTKLHRVVEKHFETGVEFGWLEYPDLPYDGIQTIRENVDEKAKSFVDQHLTGIELDPHYFHGIGSAGGPAARKDRLYQLATKWLPTSDAAKWLKKPVEELEGDTPMKAAEMSATGYIKAQKLLKDRVEPPKAEANGSIGLLI